MLGNGLHRSFGTEDVGIAFIAMQSSNIFIVTALKLGITGWAQVNGLRGGVDNSKKPTHRRRTIFTITSTARCGSISKSCRRLREL